MNVSKMVGSIGLMLALGAMQIAAHATTWYVATTGNDNNPGTQAQPFLTLHKAINTAANNDTILLADGTYNGANNRNIDFGGIDLTVKSFSNVPANCTIDCQQMGCAFILQNNQTNKSNVGGFTITNGTGFSNNGTTYGGGIYITNTNPVVSNCIFTGNTAGYYGGGLFGGTANNCTFTNNSVSSGNGGGGMAGGTATNCIFIGNTAYQGGGMNGGTAVNCTFTNNTATNGGGLYNGPATNCTFNNNSATYGGGIYIYASGPAVNCTFINNSATYGGGGIYNGTANNCTFSGNMTTSNYGRGGGGMDGGTANNCTFINNSTTNSGGGTFNSTANSCTFTNNTANGGGGGMDGGNATNCVFFGNQATQYTSGSTTTAAAGGGVYATNLYFCTLAGNSAMGAGGGLYLVNNTVTNCIIWGNTSIGGNNNVSGSSITITYSDIQNGFNGMGNINADPLFVNPVIGNLRLSAGSPCSNSATTTPPSGFTLPTTDLDGEARMIGSKPDMGAYEYGNPPPAKNLHNLLWQNNVSGDVVYWQMNLTQYVTFGSLSPDGLNAWKVVGYADITGNGSPALIWQNKVSGDVAYWQFNGTTYNGTWGYLSQGIDPSWQVVAVADITGDGKPDLIWQNSVTGDVIYWQMNYSPLNVPVLVSYGYIAHGIDTTWKIVGCAAMNGDGQNGLIWQNSNSGDVVYWKMMGTTYTGFTYLSQGVDPSWQVVAVGDITGDGQPDLIWQNSVSGSVVYWQMNGTTRSSFAAITPIITDTTWKIVGLK